MLIQFSSISESTLKLIRFSHKAAIQKTMVSSFVLICYYQCSQIDNITKY